MGRPAAVALRDWVRAFTPAGPSRSPDVALHEPDGVLLTDALRCVLSVALARLRGECELGARMPPGLFDAVAEVFAWLFAVELQADMRG